MRTSEASSTMIKALKLKMKLMADDGTCLNARCRGLQVDLEGSLREWWSYPSPRGIELITAIDVNEANGVIDEHRDMKRRWHAIIWIVASGSGKIGGKLGLS